MISKLYPVVWPCTAICVYFEEIDLLVCPLDYLPGLGTVVSQEFWQPRSRRWCCCWEWSGSCWWTGTPAPWAKDAWYTGPVDGQFGGKSSPSPLARPWQGPNPKSNQGCGHTACGITTCQQASWEGGCTCWGCTTRGIAYSMPFWVYPATGAPSFYCCGEQCWCYTTWEGQYIYSKSTMHYLVSVNACHKKTGWHISSNHVTMGESYTKRFTSEQLPLQGDCGCFFGGGRWHWLWCKLSEGRLANPCPSCHCNTQVAWLRLVLTSQCCYVLNYRYPIYSFLFSKRVCNFKDGIKSVLNWIRLHA